MSDGAKRFDTDNPSKAAAQLLAAYPDYPDGSVRLPINVFALARDLNIDVEFRDFNGSGHKNVSGILIKQDPGERFIAALNAAEHPHRQRFTLAHELGHWIHKYQDLPDSQTAGKVEYRNEVSSWGTDPEEIWADQFAAALLMPAGSVISSYSKAMTVKQMSRLYGVSPKALRLRLKNLGFSDAETIR